MQLLLSALGILSRWNQRLCMSVRGVGLLILKALVLFSYGRRLLLIDRLRRVLQG